MRRCYSPTCGRTGLPCYSCACTLADTVWDRLRRAARSAPQQGTNFMGHVQQLAARGAFGPIALEFDAVPQRYCTLRHLAGHLIAEKIAEPFAWKFSMLQLLLFAQLGIAVSRDRDEGRPRKYSHSAPRQNGMSASSSGSRLHHASQSSQGSADRSEAGRDNVFDGQGEEEDDEKGVEDLVFFGPKGTTTTAAAGGDGETRTPERIVKRIIRRKKPSDEFSAMGMTPEEAAVLKAKMLQMQSVLEEELKELQQQEVDLYVQKFKESIGQDSLKLQDLEDGEEYEVVEEEV